MRKDRKINVFTSSNQGKAVGRKMPRVWQSPFSRDTFGTGRVDSRWDPTKTETPVFSQEMGVPIFGMRHSRVPLGA
jgi:hypothetical protein